MGSRGTARRITAYLGGSDRRIPGFSLPQVPFHGGQTLHPGGHLLEGADTRGLSHSSRGGCMMGCGISARFREEHTLTSSRQPGGWSALGE
jgi:hypothetical protein